MNYSTSEELIKSIRFYSIIYQIYESKYLNNVRLLEKIVNSLIVSYNPFEYSIINF